MFDDLYRGRRIWLTGHTGFKGAWLARWLLELGAEVHGYALPPDGPRSLFEDLGLATRMHHRTGDVRDLDSVRKAFEEASPDVVFHLAAQPIVRVSYREPAETFATNVLGTVHVLEAARRAAHPCAIVVVTSDKCYENTGKVGGYDEDDPMGGHDPYSASKGAAELVVASYRRSFFASGPVRVATARAGNVVGGGDWAEDRIVPDCVKHLERGQPIPVRNPASTRPWQHVLEPLSGYLLLAARLMSAPEAEAHRFATSFNFGPGPDGNRTVGELVSEVLLHWPGATVGRSDPGAPHEAALLQLAIHKANEVLGWHPTWGFPETIARTVAWYRERLDRKADPDELCGRDLAAYSANPCEHSS